MEVIVLTIGIVGVVSLVIDGKDRTRSKRQSSLTSYGLSICSEDGDIVPVGVGVVAQDIAADGGIVPGRGRDIVGDGGLIGDRPTDLLQHTCPKLFIRLIYGTFIVLGHVYILLFLVGWLLAQ